MAQTDKYPTSLPLQLVWTLIQSHVPTLKEYSGPVHKTDTLIVFLSSHLWYPPASPSFTQTYFSKTYCGFLPPALCWSLQCRTLPNRQHGTLTLSSPRNSRTTCPMPSLIRAWCFRPSQTPSPVSLCSTCLCLSVFCSPHQTPARCGWFLLSLNRKFIATPLFSQPPLQYRWFSKTS